MCVLFAHDVRFHITVFSSGKLSGHLLRNSRAHSAYDLFVLVRKSCLLVFSHLGFWSGNFFPDHCLRFVKHARSHEIRDPRKTPAELTCTCKYKALQWEPKWFRHMYM